MSQPTSISGRELWALLPAVYRDRDKDGDLAKYLDSCGELLDRLRATLDQRLADCFPESPPGEPQAQAWLLPYFADLLDVRLLSPFVEGRRREVARAIAWRQSKGTRRTIEQIAEALGQLEVEVHEGWQRVAVTPRVDMTLLPAAAFGEPEEPDPRNPLAAARHPGLPVATVDLRLPSRAIIAEPGHPLARTSRFAGRSVTWRQLQLTGAPCFPGSYEDASRRTVDLRTPSWQNGHFHPRRLLLFLPPPTGFFPLDQVTLMWSERGETRHQKHIVDDGRDPRHVFNPSRLSDSKEAFTVTVTTAPSNFDEGNGIAIEDLNFLKTLTVTSSRLVLERVAAKKVVVRTEDVQEPVLRAADCLFDDIVAEQGLVRLEHCTVRGTLTCRRLQASDCLFAGAIGLRPQPGDPPGCVRFSRLPPEFDSKASKVPVHAVTTDEPVFFKIDFYDRTGTPQRATAFGDPGYGTLHPATPDSICFGAEDGGEMGAGHHRRFSLARAAVAGKLEEFLPVGMEAVLIPDRRLLVAPPRTKSE